IEDEEDEDDDEEPEQHQEEKLDQHQQEKEVKIIQVKELPPRRSRKATPDTPIFEVPSPPIRKANEVTSTHLQQKKNKTTPTRKVYRSMKRSPIRRSLPSPPVPEDASSFQEYLLTRPVRSDVRLPEEHLKTKQQVVVTSQKSITKFLQMENTSSPSSSSSDDDDDDDDEDNNKNKVMHKKTNEKLERLVSFTVREELQEQQTEETWCCTSCGFSNVKIDSYHQCVVCGTYEHHHHHHHHRHLNNFTKLKTLCYTGTEYEDENKIVPDVFVKDEDEKKDDLKEQNELLQRRLKRLEQQIAIMTRSARRSYPREQSSQQQQHQQRQQQQHYNNSTLMTRPPITSSIYAQGDAFRISGWSLFGRWKACFCRIQGDKLLCWDSREDALGGQRADLVISLKGQTIQLCDNKTSSVENSNEEESYFRIVTKKNSSTQLRMRGMNKKGSAYWFARLKDKELELEFEQDLMRRYGTLAAQKAGGQENVRVDLFFFLSVHSQQQRRRQQQQVYIEPHVTSEARLLAFLRSPSAFGSHVRPPIRDLDLSVTTTNKRRQHKRLMGISSRAIDILALSLRNHFYVHRLSLRGSLRSSRHLAVLSKSLELNASLTFLDLSNNEVVFANQAMPEEFVDAMRTNGNIQELVLDRNGLATLEIKTLVPGVLHNITTLSLRSNRIDDEGARVLVNWILLRTKSLRNLDLASNEITDVGASKISEALSSSSSTLYTLDLSKNEIKDDGAVSIANALKQSSSVLRTLHLEHNPFTSQASREIAKMARVNLSLTHLSFAHYVLDNSALQSLRVAFDFF
ncbi:hypothetical protein OAV88_03465, partial [bacterium]|nr:hypothetical protein [bacterium]